MKKLNYLISQYKNISLISKKCYVGRTDKLNNTRKVNDFLKFTMCKIKETLILKRWPKHENNKEETGYWQKLAVCS